MKVQWICIASAVVSTTATGAPLAAFNPSQRNSYINPSAARSNPPPRLRRRWFHAAFITAPDYTWTAAAKVKSFAGFGPAALETKDASVAGKESIAAVNHPKEFLNPGAHHPVSHLHTQKTEDRAIAPSFNQATPEASSEKAEPVSHAPPPNVPETKTIPLVRKIKTQLSGKNLEWVKSLKVKGFWKRLIKRLQDWYNASTKNVPPGAKLPETNHVANPDNMESVEALHAADDGPLSSKAEPIENEEHTVPPRQASYLDRFWPTEENSAIYRWWYGTHPKPPDSPIAPPQIAESTPNHFGNLKTLKHQNTLDDSAKKVTPDAKLPEIERVPEAEYLGSTFGSVATPSKGKTILESEAGPSSSKAGPAENQGLSDLLVKKASIDKIHISLTLQAVGLVENAAWKPPARQESLSNYVQSALENLALYKWLFETQPESPHQVTTSSSTLSHVDSPTPLASEKTLEGETVQNALALIDTKELALMAHSSIWEGGPPLKFLAAITSNAAVERMLQSLIDAFALKLERKLQEFQIAPRVLTVANEALKKANSQTGAVHPNR